MLDTRPSWDTTWLSVADTIALRSRCSRAQVGCVIVDHNQTIKSVSYNGPPFEMSLDGPCINWCPRAQGKGTITSDYSNCFSNHAEINGISRMSYGSNDQLTAYINRFCCISCAKALASANIKRVVCKKTNIDNHLNIDEVTSFLESSGVHVDIIE